MSHLPKADDPIEATPAHEQPDRVGDYGCRVGVNGKHETPSTSLRRDPMSFEEAFVSEDEFPLSRKQRVWLSAARLCGCLARTSVLVGSSRLDETRHWGEVF